MPEQSPDWVPSIWTRGRFNRWFGSSPLRMMIWFAFAPIIGATAALGSALAGSWMWAVALAVVTVVLVGQACIYAPRAWKAFRSGAS